MPGPVMVSNTLGPAVQCCTVYIFQVPKICTAGQRVLLTITAPGPSFFTLALNFVGDLIALSWKVPLLWTFPCFDLFRLRITASKWDNSLPNRSGNSLWRNPSKKTRRRTRLKFKVNGGKKGVQIRRNTETISHLHEMGCFCVNLS